MFKFIINKILNLFNIYKIDISDEEYQDNLKKFVDKVGNEEGEPLIVPNDNFKKILSKGENK